MTDIWDTHVFRVEVDVPEGGDAPDTDAMASGIYQAVPGLTTAQAVYVRPLYDDEVLANVNMAIQRVTNVYGAMRATHFGSFTGEMNELGEALADLGQARRWLAGLEVPS